MNQTNASYSSSTDKKYRNPFHAVPVFLYQVDDRSVRSLEPVLLYHFSTTRAYRFIFRIFHTIHTKVFFACITCHHVIATKQFMAVRTFLCLLQQYFRFADRTFQCHFFHSGRTTFARFLIEQDFEWVQKKTVCQSNSFIIFHLKKEE